MEEPKEELVRPVVERKKIILPKFMPILGAVFLILAGIGTGFFLSQRGTGISLTGRPKIIKTEKMVGSTDVATFRDQAEGVLEKGGIDGEGTHKLIRSGGESQTAYLTSSIINLDDYLGKKVRVWGETFAAQKAGWLMDVGRVEVLQ
ncbi:hypothetical protein HZB97_01420 [Candidatus Gottesmanbacteria bacterium]|nr:hypothetical protein [Candidatus Gottesmanbacteria bacterium]